MATALKIRGEEFVHDLTRHVRVDETPRHDQHIGIVVCKKVDMILFSQ